MPIYHVDPNPDRVFYGTTIGVLLLNGTLPFIPGDVANASTYKFPVRYQVVEELLTERLVIDADPALAKPIIRGARALEKAGVAAITSDCGYMGLFQKKVAAAVNVPVFLSSWMQVPFIYRILQPGKKVGALVANSPYVREDTLLNAGVEDTSRLIIAGLEGCAAFAAAVVEEGRMLDSDAIECEVVTTASDLVQANTDVGAILLECSCLPPYAAAVHQALRLPVFDFVTMINYVYSAVAPPRYQGTMY